MLKHRRLRKIKPLPRRVAGNPGQPDIGGINFAPSYKLSDGCFFDFRQASGNFLHWTVNQGRQNGLWRTLLQNIALWRPDHVTIVTACTVRVVKPTTKLPGFPVEVEIHLFVGIRVRLTRVSKAERHTAER